MDFLWFSLIGLFAGVFAGMGMGGGTFLIPLLSIVFGVNQKVAQGINLLVFIPLAVVCLIIYFKKGYICLKNIFWLYVPAVAISGVGAFFAGLLTALFTLAFIRWPFKILHIKICNILQDPIEVFSGNP